MPITRKTNGAMAATNTALPANTEVDSSGVSCPSIYRQEQKEQADKNVGRPVKRPDLVGFRRF